MTTALETRKSDLHSKYQCAVIRFETARSDAEYWGDPLPSIDSFFRMAFKGDPVGLSYAFRRHFEEGEYTDGKELLTRRYSDPAMVQEHVLREEVPMN